MPAPKSASKLSLQSSPAGPLSGTATVPGDKSISHRALILGALSVGETRITGLLESEDVLATAAALKALGAQIKREDDGDWHVFGRGVGGLSEPSGVSNMGNSGTAARLLMGVSATHPFKTTFSGDASLSKRPMERVMLPLRQMGAQFTARDGGCLPITVSGAASPIPITYESPVASAQVKTAVLLAGLNTPGLTTVIEPQPTRDHSERMLSFFGAEVAVEDTPEGGRRITLTGQPELTGHAVTVPGDFSSAAFPMVAALLAPNSRMTLTGVGINPLRTGLLETLLEMGASVGVENRRNLSGEEVADLVVESSALKGITVPASRAPSMIDEYPALAVAAALADGETRLEGLAELRVKESDRLGAMAKGLAAAGVDVTETEDSLTIRGAGSTKTAKPSGGVRIEANLDHRIAMAFLVLGLATERPITIDDTATIVTSFPGFAALMNGLGADMKESP
ncbi:MAG TPA: 3-phosphoshikimate 1-carboxyvinyltransferase [Rhodospirillales bacterium]|nr:3-phosphoshikimate 1-carboxyvinyltransferase [Rhodospirillaceae bacterium]HJO75314.1 3-phosphoshikimate 1-carboxyvinyltransferase [Rhodospirillales bacterium]